jgi:hypothetical protein
MTGLDPAILVFVCLDTQDVDARVKPGHDESKPNIRVNHSAGFAAASAARLAAARRSTTRTDQIEPS